MERRVHQGATGWWAAHAGGGKFRAQRWVLACAVALALGVPTVPASGQSDRRSAAEAYARIIDYRLLVEKAATQRAAELPASKRQAFIRSVTREVDSDMTRFYAISEMVDLFEAGELQALVSFAATPEGRSALAKLPALGAALNPIIQRQIDDAERSLGGR